MTDETEARRLAEKLCSELPHVGILAHRDAIAASLTAAREAERERWAKLMEDATGRSCCVESGVVWARRLRENKESAE